MFTPAQCRAARGLLDWSQQQLADAARVGVVTVRQFEGGASQPRNATLDVLQRALEGAGVEFTNGGQPGVRMGNRLDTWMRVIFRDDQKAIGMTSILKALTAAISKAGRPDGGTIWHKATGAGDNIYFFSPEIVSLISEELSAWKAIPAPLPNLKPDFKSVQF